MKVNIYQRVCRVTHSRRMHVGTSLLACCTSEYNASVRPIAIWLKVRSDCLQTHLHMELVRLGEQEDGWQSSLRCRVSDKGRVDCRLVSFPRPLVKPNRAELPSPIACEDVLRAKGRIRARL